MTIRILAFASARQALGRGNLECELPDGATVGEAWAKLCAEHPALAATPIQALAVNQAYVGAETVLRQGDELAVIPPVSGG